MSKLRRPFDPTAAKVTIGIPDNAEDRPLTKRQAAELGGKKRAEITFQATPLRNCIESRESALEALFTLNKKPRLGSRAVLRNRPHSRRAVRYALNRQRAAI